MLCEKEEYAERRGGFEKYRVNYNRTAMIAVFCSGNVKMCELSEINKKQEKR